MTYLLYHENFSNLIQKAPHTLEPYLGAAGRFDAGGVMGFATATVGWHLL